MLLRRLSNSAIALSLLAPLTAVAAGCSGGSARADLQGPLQASNAAGTCSFTLTIDASIMPYPSELPGPDGTSSPIAATRDGNGAMTNVLADQVILRPADQADLAAFLAEYSGVVAGDDAVPPRPGGGGGAPATTYVIRLDPMKFPLTNAAPDAVALGYCDAMTVSSDAAAHLFALSVHEDRAGRKVALDYLAEGDAP
jgi:hypothetical protein